ncbi:hypothetical protein ACRJ4W_10830 [Streptomyces sp. GLT-R25]
MADRGPAEAVAVPGQRILRDPLQAVLLDPEQGTAGELSAALVDQHEGAGLVARVVGGERGVRELVRDDHAVDTPAEQVAGGPVVGRAGVDPFHRLVQVRDPQQGTADGGADRHQVDPVGVHALLGQHVLQRDVGTVVVS